MSLKRPTPEFVARQMVGILVGNPDAELPGGMKVSDYFTGMDFDEALEEYDQVYNLPEWDRHRDLMERSDTDGR